MNKRKGGCQPSKSGYGSGRTVRRLISLRGGPDPLFFPNKNVYVGLFLGIETVPPGSSQISSFCYPQHSPTRSLPSTNPPVHLPIIPNLAQLVVVRIVHVGDRRPFILLLLLLLRSLPRTTHTTHPPKIIQIRPTSTSGGSKEELDMILDPLV